MPQFHIVVDKVPHCITTDTVYGITKQKQPLRSFASELANHTLVSQVLQRVICITQVHAYSVAGLHAPKYATKRIGEPVLDPQCTGNALLLLCDRILIWTFEHAYM